MNIYSVTNHIELGIAITESLPGDVINIECGHYSILPFKDGITINFPNDYSKKVGLAPPNYCLQESFTRGSIIFKNTRVNNTNQDPSIIKGWYIFRKELPFEIDASEPITFIHPNGSIINTAGNNKEGFTASPNVSGAESYLPKGILEVSIPFMDEIELDTTLNHVDNKIATFINQMAPSDEIKEFENKNPTPCFNLNDFEYKAFWAVNSFIMAYGRLANKYKKLSGYSTAEFMDGLTFAKFNKLDNANFKTINFFDHYSKHHNVDPSIIQERISNKNSFPLEDYIEGYLHRLNYSQAIILMDQKIEKITKPGKVKYQKINESPLTEIEKKYLTEITLTRNSIIHTGSLSINKKLDGYDRAKKTYNNIREISEFEIYALKLPWHWYAAFQKFIAQVI